MLRLPKEKSWKQIYLMAELYMFCTNNSIPVYLEEHLGSHGTPDSIIILDGKPIIIEFKVAPMGDNRRFNIYTTQMRKYKKIGIPLVVIESIDEFHDVMRILLTHKLRRGVYVYNPIAKRLNRYALWKITEERIKNFGEIVNGHYKTEQKLRKDTGYTNKNGDVGMPEESCI